MTEQQSHLSEDSFSSVSPTDVPLASDLHLSTTLTQILTPLLNPDGCTGAARKLKLMVGYEYALVTVRQVSLPSVSLPILIAVGVEIGNGGMTLADFVSQVSDQIISWMKARDPDTHHPSWITLA